MKDKPKNDEVVSHNSVVLTSRLTAIEGYEHLTRLFAENNNVLKIRVARGNAKTHGKDYTLVWLGKVLIEGKTDTLVSVFSGDGAWVKNYDVLEAILKGYVYHNSGDVIDEEHYLPFLGSIVVISAFTESCQSTGVRGIFIGVDSTRNRFIAMDSDGIKYRAKYINTNPSKDGVLAFVEKLKTSTTKFTLKDVNIIAHSYNNNPKDHWLNHIAFETYTNSI